MTTTACTPLGEGADSITESGALDPFKGLGALLPKLAQPAWVRLIGRQLRLERRRAPSPDALRAMRRNDRKLVRLHRALAGEFTRSRAAPA